MAAEFDVVEHRHAAEQRDILKRAREPDLGPLRRMHRVDVVAAEQDFAGIRLVEAGNAIEE
jgi:hypothetical protein